MQSKFNISVESIDLFKHGNNVQSKKVKYIRLNAQSNRERARTQRIAQTSRDTIDRNGHEDTRLDQSTKETKQIVARGPRRLVQYERVLLDIDEITTAISTIHVDHNGNIVHFEL